MVVLNMLSSDDDNDTHGNYIVHVTAVLSTV